MNNEFEIDQYNVYNLPEGKKYSTCPKCSHTRKKKTQKCLMIDWDRGLATCQHATCGAKLQLHTYKSKKQDAQVKTDYDTPEPAKTSKLSQKVIDYFKGRGISERALVEGQVGEGKDWMPQFGKEVHTIHFNYYENGELVNRKYRGPQKSFKLQKGAKKILSGIDRWKDETEVVIVEGEIDELSFIEAGIRNVASVPNGATKGNQNLSYLDNCIDYFENKERILLCVDDDEAGKALEDELKRRLGAHRCFKIPLSGYNDANKLLTSEGSKALKSAYMKAKPFPIENVTTYEDTKAEYYEFLRNGMESGMKSGTPSFDRIFSSYIHQLRAFTGIPGHGKSDWGDQECIGYAKNEGYKIGFVSVENKPVFFHHQKQLAKIYGKFPDESDIGNPIFEACEKFVDEMFTFYNYDGQAYLDNVLEKGAELVKRKGIKILVIDPYNKVTIEGMRRSDDDYLPTYLNKCEAFMKKYATRLVYAQIHLYTHQTYQLL